VFQEKYFEDTFEPGFGVTPRKELQNKPYFVGPAGDMPSPAGHKPLSEAEFQLFVENTAQSIAALLGLSKAR